MRISFTRLSRFIGSKKNSEVVEDSSFARLSPPEMCAALGFSVCSCVIRSNITEKPSEESFDLVCRIRRPPVAFLRLSRLSSLPDPPLERSIPSNLLCPEHENIDRTSVRLSVSRRSNRKYFVLFEARPEFCTHDYRISVGKDDRAELLGEESSRTINASIEDAIHVPLTGLIASFPVQILNRVPQVPLGRFGCIPGASPVSSSFDLNRFAAHGCSILSPAQQFDDVWPLHLFSDVEFLVDEWRPDFEVCCSCIKIEKKKNLFLLAPKF